MTPQEIWRKYEKILEYVNKKDLFETVRINENFYNGNQWEGVKADMPKPVINILQRVVKYLVATLSSSEISISIKPFSDLEEDVEKTKPISKEVEQIIENAKIKEASRIAIRNAAVDGSCYMLQMFDSEIETYQDFKGAIRNTILDNTQVFFGNPYSSDIQKQPYIIVALRQHISQVKEEARLNGVNEDDIRPDNDSFQYNDDSDELVTVLLTFEKKPHKVVEETIEFDEEGNEVVIYKEKEVKSVCFTKTTKDVFIKKEIDLGYSRYPLACFGWDIIKNSYLYQSPLTSVINNQIFINKAVAMSQLYSLHNLFPKMIYDKNKADIDDLLDSTSASAVSGIDTMGKMLDFIKAPDFSNQVLSTIEMAISHTKECMGVNDASLGNVKPDNTSAIIALQEASNVPLELQKQAFYSFWEDVVRNIIDIMSNDYYQRKVLYDGKLADVDFSKLKNLNYQLNVDIGSGAMYSEISQINTQDKLLERGIISPKTYVESIPSKYILNKSKIVSELQSAEAEAQKQMHQQQIPV